MPGEIKYLPVTPHSPSFLVITKEKVSGVIYIYTLTNTQMLEMNLG